MQRIFTVILILSLFLFSTATITFAGSRHGYRNYTHHSGGGYSHYRYPTSHHRSSHSNHFWGYLGIGVLTGALIGSVLYHPPAPRTVYYSSTSQIIVHPEPVTVRQYSGPRTPPQELVLRRVKIIERIVNVRSGPGFENNVISQVHNNERVDVIGAAPEWLYVKTENGQYGWLMTQYTYETDRPLG